MKMFSDSVLDMTTCIGNSHLMFAFVMVCESVGEAGSGHEGVEIRSGEFLFRSDKQDTEKRKRSQEIKD